MVTRGDEIGYTLSVERDIEAGPMEVFDAFLALYDEPLPDWVLRSDRDLRVGGVWDIAFRPPGVAAFEEHRVFEAVDPPHHLEYTATISRAGCQVYDTNVSFRATRVGARTRASLTQSGFPDERTRDQFATAWPDVLESICASAEEGVGPRTAADGCL